MGGWVCEWGKGGGADGQDDDGFCTEKEARMAGNGSDGLKKGQVGEGKHQHKLDDAFCISRLQFFFSE